MFKKTSDLAGPKPHSSRPFSPSRWTACRRRRRHVLAALKPTPAVEDRMVSAEVDEPTAYRGESRLIPVERGDHYCLAVRNTFALLGATDLISPTTWARLESISVARKFRFWPSAGAHFGIIRGARHRNSMTGCGFHRRGCPRISVVMPFVVNQIVQVNPSWAVMS